MATYTLLELAGSGFVAQRHIAYVGSSANRRKQSGDSAVGAAQFSLQFFEADIFTYLVLHIH